MTSCSTTARSWFGWKANSQRVTLSVNREKWFFYAKQMAHPWRHLYYCFVRFFFFFLFFPFRMNFAPSTHFGRVPSWFSNYPSFSFVHFLNTELRFMAHFSRAVFNFGFKTIVASSYLRSNCVELDKRNLHSFPYRRHLKVLNCLFFSWQGCFAIMNWKIRVEVVYLDGIRNEQEFIFRVKFQTCLV